jgi:hypothetical protein
MEAYRGRGELSKDYGLPQAMDMICLKKFLILAVRSLLQIGMDTLIHSATDNQGRRTFT